MVLGTSTIVRVKEPSLSAIPCITLHPKVATCEQIVNRLSQDNIMEIDVALVLTDIYENWPRTRQTSKRGQIGGLRTRALALAGWHGWSEKLWQIFVTTGSWVLPVFWVRGGEFANFRHFCSNKLYRLLVLYTNSSHELGSVIQK